jgi:signal transduction histidine kinase
VPSAINASPAVRWTIGALAYTVSGLAALWPRVTHPSPPTVAAVGLWAAFGLTTGRCRDDVSARRWLITGGALWAGSATGAWAAVWSTGLSWACWPALWAVLAIGPAVFATTERRRDVMTHGLPVIAGQGRSVPPIGGSRPHRGINVAMVVIATALCTVAIALQVWAGSGTSSGWSPGSGPGPWMLAVQGFTGAAVLLGVGVSGLHRRWTRAEVTGLLTELATPPTVEGVQEVLRTALADPTATVLYRLPDVEAFVSSHGGVPSTPTERAGRVTFPVTRRDGEVTALLVVQDRPSLDTARVATALAVCAPALDNARLQAVLRARLADVSQSRGRIVQTAVAERRTLARNLHDGAQQLMLVLSTRIGLARQTTTDPAVMDALDNARDQLRLALAKLRALARDLYPPALDTEGLVAAPDTLADESPLEIRLTGEIGRVDPAIEIVSFLTVRDLLSGLAGSWAATLATVALSTGDDRLAITIFSDAAGPDTGLIDLAPPSWLSVVTDRLAAIGGVVTLRSPAERVTAQEAVWIEVSIPYE